MTTDDTTYEYQFRLVRDGVTILDCGGYSSVPFTRMAADGWLRYRDGQGRNNEGVTIEIDRRPILPTPEWETLDTDSTKG